MGDYGGGMVEALGWGVRLPWGWGSIVLRAQKGWSFVNGRGFGAWVYGYGPKGVFGVVRAKVSLSSEYPRDCTERSGEICI